MLNKWGKRKAQKRKRRWASKNESPNEVSSGQLLIYLRWNSVQFVDGVDKLSECCLLYVIKTTLFSNHRTVLTVLSLCHCKTNTTCGATRDLRWGYCSPLYYGLNLCLWADHLTTSKPPFPHYYWLRSIKARFAQSQWWRAEETT